MFISLFNTLKSTGVPCTLRELLDLVSAVEKKLAFANMQDFYYLSRAALVKDEKHYDKFDRAFDIYFKGIKSIDDIFSEHDLIQNVINLIPEGNIYGCDVIQELIDRNKSNRK